MRCRSSGRGYTSLNLDEPQEKRRTPEPGRAAGPERNHKGGVEPAAQPEQSRTTQRQDTAAQAAEQGNTDRPAGTSNDSAASGEGRALHLSPTREYAQNHYNRTHQDDGDGGTTYACRALLHDVHLVPEDWTQYRCKQVAILGEAR